VEFERKEPRIVYKKIVQATILKAPNHDDISGETYICDASDISVNGVCIHIEVFVPKESTMRLKVMRPAPIKSFVMAGRVRWVRESEPAKLWDIGVLFDESTTRDSPEWLQFIAQLSAKPS
jgi:hypothetical protein